VLPLSMRKGISSGDGEVPFDLAHAFAAGFGPAMSMISLVVGSLLKRRYDE